MEGYSEKLSTLHGFQYYKKLSSKDHLILPRNDLCSDNITTNFLSATYSKNISNQRENLLNHNETQNNIIKTPIKVLDKDSSKISDNINISHNGFVYQKQNKENNLPIKIPQVSNTSNNELILHNSNHIIKRKASDIKEGGFSVGKLPFTLQTIEEEPQQYSNIKRVGSIVDLEALLNKSIKNLKKTSDISNQSFSSDSIMNTKQQNKIISKRIIAYPRLPEIDLKLPKNIEKIDNEVLVNEILQCFSEQIIAACRLIYGGLDLMDNIIKLLSINIL